MALYQNCFQHLCPSTMMADTAQYSLIFRLYQKFTLKIFLSETTELMATKLWWIGPYMVLYQNLVGHPHQKPRWLPQLII